MNSIQKIASIALSLLLLASCQKTEILSTNDLLSNKWELSSSSLGAYCGDIFTFHLEAPREQLDFTHNKVRTDALWMPTDDFLELDWSPTIQQEGYDAMYRLNQDENILDIVNLHGMAPSPQRCGPPPFTRFKVIKLTSNEMILESYASGYQEEYLGTLPEEAVHQFTYKRS